MPQHSVENEEGLEERRRKLRTRETVAMMALSVTVLCQIVASVWWAATLSADVRHLTQRFDTMDGKQYTREDAERDIARLRDRIEDVMRRTAVLEAQQQHTFANGRRP